jgi:anti-sigma regulatory factor (Ser/Thr protein kinase)
MKAKDTILKMVRKRQKLSSEEVESVLSITRQSAHYHLSSLIRDGKMLKIGRTRGAYYVLNDKAALSKMFDGYKKTSILRNLNLEEDKVFAEIKKTTPIFNNLKPNVSHIVEYAFTEIMNNAIEHSKSQKICYSISKNGPLLEFIIKDYGIGVFNNIKDKFGLKDELEAVQELIKGKGTTAPDAHTGEGIFFTSKIADRFSLHSYKTELIFDDIAADIFVCKKRNHHGTIASFSIEADGKKELEDIFKKFSNASFVFDKSKINIKLFAGETGYMSRSQARRLLSNMEKFGRIVLDFKGINAIGQGFADQIFRVFKNEHPEIEIEAINCSDTVEMMLKHATYAGSYRIIKPSKIN